MRPFEERFFGRCDDTGSEAKRSTAIDAILQIENERTANRLSELSRLMMVENNEILDEFRKS